MLDRDGRQQQAFDGAEERRVGANAERKRDDDDARPGLVVQQPADGMAQISTMDPSRPGPFYSRKE